jgi:hypothetical protein
MTIARPRGKHHRDPGRHRASRRPGTPRLSRSAIVVLVATAVIWGDFMVTTLGL